MSATRVMAHPNWLAAIRRYLVAAAIGHLTWEVAQLPLYTLARSAPPSLVARAMLHCTAGDVAIASIVPVLALATVGTADWPKRRRSAVAVVVVRLSVTYTAYSEYINTVIRPSWAYTDSMPTLLGIGLSPLAQWVIVPVLALA